MPDFWYPCFYCHAEIQFGAHQSVICRYCAKRNTRPKSTDATLEYLKRANHLFQARDYEKAEQSYNRVLDKHPDEHEALMGRVLSLYGIEYIYEQGPQTYKILVHFPQPTPFTEQADYLAACEAARKDAPPDVLTKYQQDAAYIDAVQQQIHALAQQCATYDIFLCFKETTLDGTDKTADYQIAAELYQQLSKTYRVFFSSEELNKTAAGSNYEAAIYRALETSRLMIVIGTSPEHMAATWPHSEWQRYLEWYDGLHKTPLGQKRLIPLYSGMSREELPAAFLKRSLQDLCWDQPNAMDRLEQAVDGFFKETDAPEYRLLKEIEDLKAQLEKQETTAPAEPNRENDQLRQQNETLSAELLRYKFSVFEWKQEKDGIHITKYIGHQDTVIVPEGTVAIDASAFEGATMKKVSLPHGLRFIGNAAFGNCKRLTEITLPASLNVMGNNPFCGCPLTSIVVQPGNLSYTVTNHMLIDTDVNRVICYPIGLAQKKCTLPDDIINIGTEAFLGSQLTEIILPKSLRTISASAFAHCKKLTYLQVPEGVRSIQAHAFEKCTGLLAVTLPATLSKISDNAFQGCLPIYMIALGNSYAAQYAKAHGSSIRLCMRLLPKFLLKLSFPFNDVVNSPFPSDSSSQTTQE